MRASDPLADFNLALEANRPIEMVEPAVKPHPKGRREALRQQDAPDNKAAAKQPEIRIVPSDLAGMVDAADTALAAARLGIYQRNGVLVVPTLTKIAISGGRQVEAQNIAPISQNELCEVLGKAAIWQKYNERKRAWLPAGVPEKVAATLLERKRSVKAVPELSGIINAPTLRADGSLLDQPGYDEATALLYDPRGTVFPAIPQHPNKDDALAALAALKDLVSTFNFVEDIDMAVALSAFLSQAIRRSLPTVPMHGFTAPVAGSGKSKLVDMASVLVTGREAAAISLGQNEAELEKRLMACFLAAEQSIAIDNAEAPVGGQFLCSALSQVIVRGRVLGKSEAPELPSNAFITATGNNLALLGDMTRRTVLCRLDPKCERPELREFDREPVAYAKENRGRLLTAALTILRAYFVAGRPAEATPLGGFEAWSRTVRDALIWLGEGDPAATMETARELDPQLAALTAVIQQWQDAIGGRSVTVRQLIDCATETRTGDWGRLEPHRPDFREALLAVAGEGGAINGRKLGKWLGTSEGRIVAGVRIMKTGLREGIMTWGLVSAE